jgi:hypothetical protein
MSIFTQKTDKNKDIITRTEALAHVQAFYTDTVSPNIKPIYDELVDGIGGLALYQTSAINSTIILKFPIIGDPDSLELPYFSKIYLTDRMDIINFFDRKIIDGAVVVSTAQSLTQNIVDLKNLTVGEIPCMIPDMYCSIAVLLNCKTFSENLHKLFDDNFFKFIDFTKRNF